VSEGRLFHWLSAGLLVGLLGLMLASFDDYGMTADEPVQNRYGNRLLRWYATLGADRSAVEQHDTYYYGGLFELVAQGAEQLSPFGLYETRHLVNALFGFTGIAAAWWMGTLLGGPLGGFLAAAFLAATPLFYGHAFNNPKDIPFASLYAMATAALVRLRLDRPPDLRGPALRGLLLAGVAIGLAAAVRVAGLALLGFAALPWLASAWLAGRRKRAWRPSWRDLGCLALGLALLTSVAWLVMVAFWPYAQLDPLRHPFTAFRAFSDFWQSMPVLYDGVLVPSGVVSRYYMPWLFAITLPELYLVAFVMGLWLLLTLPRRWPLAAEGRSRLLHFAWLAVVTALPLAWAVLDHTPFYNGNRHLLFIVPGLAVLAGVSAARWLRAPRPVGVRVAGAVLLAAAVAWAVVDMVELHPYQSVYFNRLVGGGLRGAATRYETDYWCASYREGIEWIVGAYSQPGRERVRVAGHSTLVQVQYDLRRDEGRRRRFEPVTIHDDPHLVLATTATGDDKRTPGRVVHVIERQGMPLLYVFELKAPR
jgi:hypothetical protein